MKHSFLRRLGALVLALALAVPAMAAPASAASGPVDPAPVITDFTFSPSSVTMERDTEDTRYELSNLIITATLSDGSTKTLQPSELTWTTNDKSIVTINTTYYRLVARSQGDTTVTATTTDGSNISKDLPVHVVAPPPAPEPVSFVTLSQSNITMTLPARPANPPKPVTATLQASVTYTGKADFAVNWSKQGPDGVIDYQYDESTGVLTITAVGGGSVVLTATAKTDSTKSAQCRVTVNASGVINVSGLSLSKTELALDLAQSEVITASVLPTNVKERGITVTTEPLGVVAVIEQDNGTNPAKKFQITGMSVGKAKITFTSVADPTRSAVCEVEVSPALSGLTIEGTTGAGADRQIILRDGVSVAGDHQLIHATPTSSIPNTAPRYDASRITWTTSDPSVATIQKDASYANGCYAVLTLAGPGEAEITVKYGTSDDVKDSCKVTVPGIFLKTTSGVLTMVNNSLTMQVGQTEQLAIEAFGKAKDTASAKPTWWSSDSSVVDAANGKLIARTPGTATVEVTRGGYSTKCTVTVKEDTTGLITASGTYSAGKPLALSSLLSQLNSVSMTKTGAALSYITNLSVPTDQGILHNTHRSEADTGAGVGSTERYYPSGNSLTSLSALSFVPRSTFNGTAEISYTGFGNGKAFNGTIQVAVSGTGQSTDITYSSNGSPVAFQSDDFNSVVSSKTGRSLKYVTFTPPQSSVGTLYYGYTDASHPGEKVESSTQYRRTGSPALDRVSFVPADGYSGSVRISYRAMDTSNTPYTGTVTINVTRTGTPSDPADIYYYAPQDGWAVFQARDFSSASLRVIGEQLSYVRFELPPSSEGTLFHNYRGYGDYDSAVASTTSYRVTGSPSLDRVAFVPATTSTGQTAIKYTGYSVRGTTFTGTVYINPRNAGNNNNNTVETDLWYTVNTGASVAFNVYDFNNACIAATGASLSYIRFPQLPAIGQGTLRYRTGNNNTSYGTVLANTSYYRTSTNSWDVLIGSISFQASKTFTGTVRIPFTGYNTNGVSFTDEVVIQVTPNIITYSSSNANTVRLSASRVRSAHSNVLTGQLSYITFTSLPDPSAGHLYLNYSGFNTGTQVNTGTRYYASSTPSIDQITFVPRGKYQGETSVTYTAYSTTGEQVNGQITFYITNSGGSSYFSDMGSHTWAATAVDYLYQNGVTNGVTATTFGPSQNILRRDFVLMLCRAFHFSGGSGYSFADVPTNAYYAQAVATAKRLGIANGDGNNFMPNAQITRQDAMVMIKNALDAANISQPAPSATVLSRFPDNGSVASYARSAVSILVQLGAVNGDNNGMLNPRSSITRAEAAVILHYVMTM